MKRVSKYFNIFYRRKGKMHFLRVGYLSMSFCVSKHDFVRE